MSTDADVVIIGAGPSGSVAAKLLHDKGYKVLVIERQKFPRFSIGESLLPQCMVFLEQAGMVEAVRQHGFQYKNGAMFDRDGKGQMVFDFREKFSEGPGTTFQVQRADFDNLLIQQAINAGVEVHFEEEILSVDQQHGTVQLTARDKAGQSNSYSARFVLDASGFGRVLPRLLDLESPSGFPVRQSLFTHIEDNISDPQYDRDKIRIVVHPEHKDVWYWLIPFSNGRCSIGVVAETAFFDQFDNGDNAAMLQTLVSQDPGLRGLLADARWDTPVNRLTGYSANVKQLAGDYYALLGNAGEFLDPVFSSGVTIALKSASMAAAVLDRQLQGESVDWQRDYAEPLQRGVNVFRDYVEAWYDGRFQDIIFAKKREPRITRMICSILAGYAWDEDNLYVAQSKRRLNTLAEICRDM
ncbi:MAG TPA: NAD(P)/FAD-dependent oxidoreductase [Pseudomonadales bacterium]